MADIVNLRQFRKLKARADSAKAAEAARAVSGRTKADKVRDRAEKDSAKTVLDGHRRETRPPDDKS